MNLQEFAKEFAIPFGSPRDRYKSFLTNRERFPNFGFESSILQTVLIDSLVNSNPELMRRRNWDDLVVVPMDDSLEADHVLLVLERGVGSFDAIRRDSFASMLNRNEFSNSKFKSWHASQRITNPKMWKNVDSALRLERAIKDLDASVVAEFIRRVDTPVVYVPVDDELTKRRSKNRIPDPALQVDYYDNSGTVGVISKNADDITGVTIARHVLSDNPTTCLIGEEVEIDGEIGSIVSENFITDSCFASIDTEPYHAKNIRPPRPELPSWLSDCTFNRKNAGQKTTTFRGWSPDYYDHSSLSQRKVFTDNDLIRGDSGTALIDCDGYVLGFAFRRAGIKAKVQHSSWISADSVYTAHRLFR